MMKSNILTLTLFGLGASHLGLAAVKNIDQSSNHFDSFNITNHTDQHLFGYKQAIDDKWLVIGALGNANLNQHGMAFVYQKIGAHWLLHTTLQADNPVTGDGFGSHISISNNQIFITSGSRAPQPNVYIYELNNSEQWEKTASFEISAFVHLAAHDHNQIILGHSARLIEKIGNQWIQTHEFFPNHFFELQAIDLNKDQVIFGFDEYAEIHSKSNDQWQLTDTLQPADVSIKNDTEFGKSVTINNNWAGVGAFHDNDNGQCCAGAAYVFQNNKGHWQETQKLLLSNGESGDFFGFSLSNRNDQFVIATASPRGLGSYHFRPNAVGTWQERHLLDNFNGQLMFVNNSFDHAVACNGSCTVFTTPLFKDSFD